MGKGIYTYYRERLVGIGGNNKCLYMRSTARKTSYDLGAIIEGRRSKVREFTDFLWEKKKVPFTLISENEKEEILENLRATVPAPIAESDRKKALSIETETAKIKELKREAEAIEKET